MNLLFNGSPYLLINTVYPNMIKPWEMQVAPSGYWNLETASEAIKWIIEDKLNWSDEEILNNLSLEVFTQYKLSGMMQIFFRSSTIKAIECAYPGKFRPWDFKIVPQGYWMDKENVKQCVIWFVEEKFRWSDEEVIEKYTQQILYDLGLSGILNYYSILETLILTYPNKDWSRKKHEKYARVGGIVNHKLNRSRYFSEYTKSKKDKGLCLDCGKVLDRQGAICTNCNERRTIKLHELHNNGKCIKCGNDLNTNRWRCNICLEKINTAKRMKNWSN